MNQYCFLNGKIVPMEEAKVSVLDIGLLRGYGIYEGIAGIKGKPFRFSDHWDRFLSGAHILNLNVPITHDSAEKKIIELLEKNGHTERANIRIILTGGNTINGIEFDFENPTFYIVTEKWEKLKDEYYTEGAKLITQRHLRELPEYKTINYIKSVNLQDHRKSEGAAEILFTYDDQILECATSNIFIVKDGVVITPEEDILKGITRKVIIEICNGKYSIETRPIDEGELRVADEVFITSSFKDIVPIVKIDEFEVGNGEPGPITKDLMATFAQILKM